MDARIRPAFPSRCASSRSAASRAAAAPIACGSGGQTKPFSPSETNSSVPPVVFHVNGIVEFPFDRARELTAITTLKDFARTCGDAAQDEADMLMISSRQGDGPATAVDAIRRVRPDLAAVTNEELVARFQQVEFSYFRQISVVLATITMLFGGAWRCR